MHVTPRVIIENGVIVLGLVTFWPFVFGHRSGPYTAWMIAVLLALGVLAVVRFRRFLTALAAERRTRESAPPPHFSGRP